MAIYPNDAACRTADPELFFPLTETGGPAPRATIEKAKRICGGCPVLAHCRDLGMREADGIWGGLTASERLLYRRRGAGELSLLDLDSLTA
ncbi:MAG: WhiB family transcriptional regulator [Gemmatimonadales bacterium]|jgi:WhiB family transcriptional regulator, redox-sensing transcriptional regulator